MLSATQIFNINDLIGLMMLEICTYKNRTDEEK